jgi:hypothetical protein
MSRQAARTPANVRIVYLLEWTVPCLLCLAVLNLTIVMVMGSYRLALGPLRVSVSQLMGPLLLLLGLALITLWLQGRRHGIPSRLRLRPPWLLFLGVLFIYSANGRALTAGDTIPASYLPLSLLREFDFDLDEFPFLYEPVLPWFVQRAGDHIVSSYPPWAGVLAVPVYLLPVVSGLSVPSPVIHDLEKLAATLVTALSVVLLLLALRRLTHEKVAWFIAIVYAFGTSSFSSSSQALWQHGPSQLFLTLTIYWLVRGLDEPRFSAYAGLALASAIICRPTNALMAFPIAAYILWHRRDYCVGFLVAALPPILLLATYNMHYFGSPLTTGFVGTTGPARIWSSASHLFSTPLHEGLAGVLGSPSRGLFIYSPIFLCSIIGMAMVWKDPKQVLLRCVSLAPVLIILLSAKWISWWGGGSYGPRLLADITPFLCLYLYPPCERAQSKPLWQYVLMGLAVLSITFHGIRVFAGGDWNGHPNVDWYPERLWSWTDSPLQYYGKNLAMDMRAKVARLATSFPTSRDAPQELAASYQLTSLSPGMTLPPNASFLCQVLVLNEGKAVWLARAKGEKGEVRLRWRWLMEEREVPSASGGWMMGYDVLPGQTYEFTLGLATPREPGEYTLELGLVSTGVSSFADAGVAPLKIPMQVIPSPPNR